MALRPAVFDRHILSLDVAGFAQSLAERAHQRCKRAGRRAVENADHRHRLLLCAPGERPCRHRAGEKNYEVASPHARPLALTASKDYGSRGPPRIGGAKGSLPPTAAVSAGPPPSVALAEGRQKAYMTPVDYAWFGLLFPPLA